MIPLLLLPVLLAGSGCASRGNPQPPSLHLPAKATALRAERIANQVHLSWTVSNKTSDGLIQHGPIDAVLCRDLASVRKSAVPAPCTAVAHVAVAPGQGDAVDKLPASLLTDPPAAIAYRVELFNAKGRSAGPSDAVIAASGLSPEPVTSLHLEASPEGAVLEWQKAAPPALTTVELTRTLTAGPLLTAVVPSAARSKKATPSLPSTSAASDPGAPVQLRPRHGGEHDPGGLLDPAVQPHNTYTYVAQRIRLVTLRGHEYELRSEASPPVTIALKDSFPPRSPSGLESIASAPLNAPASIDLSWEPSLETDLLGYRVYRATGQGSFVRLTADPLTTPEFRDPQVQPHQPYRYYVTAVDRSNNESAPSSTIEETLP